MFADADRGALQVSAYRNEEEDVSDEDLQAFASEHVDGDLALEPTVIGAFDGYCVSYEEGDSWWSEWFGRNGRVLLYVTYNCAVADQGEEFAEVEEILESLCCHEDEDGDELPDEHDDDRAGGMRRPDERGNDEEDEDEDEEDDEDD